MTTTRSWPGSRSSTPGKPIQEAIAVDGLSGADAIEYYAGLAASIHGETFDLGSAWAYTRREPLGVCVGIGAWNYPIQIACWKSAPALACGNSMVFKPAELTPLTALRLAEIYSEAGLPDGVFNVVQGDHRTGEALVSHPDVAKVSLTGEVGTGKIVMANAAATLKHVTLELGGKSPLIIFDDADLDNAVSAALMANFYTQGEICSNGTRVYVHEEIHDEFLDRLVTRTSKMKIGDPMDPDTHVGALVSRTHGQGSLLHRCRQDGRGDRGNRWGASLDPSLEGGFFVGPTVFDACTDDMSIVQEEIFGPVMSVLSFHDEDDVIARANELRMAWRRECHQGHPACPSGGRPARGRDDLDQQLQHHPDRDALRRLQAVRDRPGEQPGHHQPLHAGEERVCGDGRRRGAVLSSNRRGR